MLLFFITGVCVLIFQLTVLAFHPVMGVKPDLFLVFVINTALLAGPKFGLLTGFCLGMLQDLFLGGMFAIYTIINTVLGGFIGFSEGHFYKKNVFIPFLATFIFSLLHEFLTILLSKELIFNVNYLQAFKSIILPTAIYNSILGLILYIILYKIIISRGKLYE